MKKNWFYLFMLMAITVMPLTSCDKEDEQPKPQVIQQHDPNSDSDQSEITAYDAMEWLQNSLVIVDENGEVIRRVYGKPLDESQPDVISVSVADYAAAEKLFLSWVATDKEATKVEGGYDYNLTDAEGKAQGGVLFRAVEGEGGVIARMTLKEGTNLKQISEVQFIATALWPENDEIPVYRKGEIYGYSMETILRYGKGRGDWSPFFGYVIRDFSVYTSGADSEFYCIQGNENGQEGILVCLSDDEGDSDIWALGTIDYYATAEEYYTSPDKVYNLFASVSEAEKVLAVYNADKDAWKKMLKIMDEREHYWSPRHWPVNVGNSEFLLNSFDSEDEKKRTKFKCLDLDSHPGEINYVKTNNNFYWYRYILVRIIPPATV